jgi:DNA ligase (NAD+)
VTTVNQRIAELCEQIRTADHEYYNLGQPSLSDVEYDRLYAELRQLEAEYPDMVRPDSPTRRIGAPLPKGSSFATARHLAPMLSIESLMTAGDVDEFDARARRTLEFEDGQDLAWACEPKLDGVSASLLYEHGNLVRGLSRGDGEQGEDITQNLRTIRNLPLRLAGKGPFPSRIELRGEVIMTKAHFAKLQEVSETSAETQFRNARNTVAGTLKLLDPRAVAARPLDFLCFATGHAEGLRFETHSELRAILTGWGLQVTEPYAVVTGAAGVRAFRDDLERRRDDLPYEMDGIVAKLDRIDLQNRLGRTARTPRWALAYKFAPRLAITRIVAIGAQVGRTGAVTPVANLEPVELAGVTVRNASLHNWGLLAERDIRAGDTVEIQRAGDVIPEVVRVLPEQRPAGSRPTAPPTACPECAAPLAQEGKFLYCSNLDCRAQVVGRIVHLVARRALDIEGLGPKQVEQLFAAGLLGSVEDVFLLPQKRAAVLELDRWGEKSFDNLAAQIDKAKSPGLARFLNAIGIRHVGEQTAKDLAAHFGSLPSLQAASKDQLLEVDGVGEEVAESLLRFFGSPPNQRTLRAFADAGVRVQDEVRRGAGPLQGRVFVFTGGLASMGRDEARLRVEQLGGATASSITKQTTDVVAGEAAGSKIEKAKKLGIPILDEEQFRRLLESTQ